jgi:Raf kinase inhibitor-like YbhB/YbcL family protein
MHMTSPAFTEGKIIPSLYTCEGKNWNPPLQFSDVPESPKNLRPDGMYDHWIFFNIDPHTRSIPENAPSFGVFGKNTGGKNQYTGPCPPDREHRYFFKLYALDKMLDLSEGASKTQVEEAMQGHILAQCSLMGRYEKGKGY